MRGFRRLSSLTVAVAAALPLLLGRPRAAEAQRMKLGASLPELESRAQRDSNDAAAHYNVALAYWNEKRWSDTERELRRAVALDQRFAAAHLALGYLPYARRPQLWQEQYVKRPADSVAAMVATAEREWQRAYLIDPMVEQKIVAAALPPRSASWDLFAGDVYDTYLQGFNDYCDGNYDHAFGRYQHLYEMLDLDRKHDRAPVLILWFHGLAAGQLRKYDVAVADFQRLLDASLKEEQNDSLHRFPLPTNDFRYVLAVMQQRAGHVDEATRLYHEALESDVGLYMAHVQLANMFEAQRDFPHAAEERQRAVDANPDDTSLLTDLAVTLGRAGRFAEAEKALQQAIGQNPSDARPMYWLGIAELQLDHRPEAKSAFEHFVAMAPSRYEQQLASARQHIAELN